MQLPLPTVIAHSTAGQCRRSTNCCCTVYQFIHSLLPSSSSALQLTTLLLSQQLPFAKHISYFPFNVCNSSKRTLLALRHLKQCYFAQSETFPADTSGHTVCGPSLAGIAGSNVSVCLSVVSVVCCQVEVSVTGRSFVQRSPTDCGVS